MEPTNPDAAASAPFYTPAAQLALVRRWLCASMEDFSEIMGVEPATITAWLASRSTPQASGMARMRQLHRLATAWRELGGQPLANLATNTESTARLKSMLGAPVLDESAVLASFRSMAAASRPRRTRAERIARQAGLGTDEHDEAGASFDAETLFESSSLVDASTPTSLG